MELVIGLVVVGAVVYFVFFSGKKEEAPVVVEVKPAPSFPVETKEVKVETAPAPAKVKKPAVAKATAQKPKAKAPAKKAPAKKPAAKKPASKAKKPATK